MAGRPIDVRKSTAPLIAAVLAAGCDDTGTAAPEAPERTPSATAAAPTRTPAPTPAPTHVRRPR